MPGLRHRRRAWVVRRSVSVAAVLVLAAAFVAGNPPQSTRADGAGSTLALAEIALPGTSGFKNPDHIVAGPDGNLWFTEWNGIGNCGASQCSGGALGRITPSGAITEFPLTFLGATNPRPIGITVGPDPDAGGPTLADLWFTESGTNRIGRVTTGGTITTFTGLTAGGVPVGIALGPDGNLWFTVQDNASVGGTVDQIGRITPAGVVTTFILPTGSQAREIVAGPDGNIWFTEQGTNRIGRLNPVGADGAIQASITEFSVPTAASQPYGIASGPDGNLWFTERTGNNIGRITPAGTFTEFPVPTSGSQPAQIASAAGDLWFTEFAGNMVGRVTTTGDFSEYVLGHVGNAGPFGVAGGPDNAVWFTEHSPVTGKIGRLDLRDPLCADASCTTLVVNSSADTDDSACTADPGGCTLREAINAANAAPDLTSIDFNIPGGGTQTISVVSALPAVVYPVVIDGSTQPGFAPANATDPVTPTVVIDNAIPSTPPNTHGLRLQTGYTLVTGLSITDFNTGSGVLINKPVNFASSNFNTVEATRLSGNHRGVTISADPNFGAANNNAVEGNYIVSNLFLGISLENAAANRIGGTAAGDGNVVSGNGASNGAGIRVTGTDNVIEGNKVGTNYVGTAAMANGTGIEVLGAGTTVGGSAAARNVISGNTFRGVVIGESFGFAPTTGATVSHNYIGVSADGTSDVGNGWDGIYIADPAGTSAAATITDNVISGNNQNGIKLENVSGGVLVRVPQSEDSVVVPGLTIQSNLIGTAADGTTAVGNGANGILSWDYMSVLVGGTTAGDGNTIANNGQAGVRLEDNFTFTGINNAIWGNSIHSNTGIGIDLVGGTEVAGVTANDADDDDDGANHLQNFPVLDTAENVSGTTTVDGTLDAAAGNYRIEFFANAACDAALNGEGRTFLGALASQPDGAFSFQATGAAVGEVITATATDENNNTSEFSACVSVTAGGDTPVAVGDSYDVPKNDTLLGGPPGVLGNDTDTDTPASGLSVASVNGSAANVGAATDTTNGSVTLETDGSFSYTPDTDYTGPDSFTYTITDGALESASATVSITVTLPDCTTPPFSDVAIDHPFCREIQWLEDNDIANGFDDGTYRPAMDTTRQAMSAFMARLAGATLTPCTTPPFSDVPITHPFCAEIKWMDEEGISTGFNDGTYRPAEAVTRQAMSAFMSRLAGGTPAPCLTEPFTDVAIDHPFCPEIQWMKAQGVSTGFNDDTYRPEIAVTRQAMAAFLYRVSLILP